MQALKRITIAIDGPSGAGKSTAARGVAARLGYTYIDTGAMYRAVAWNAIRQGFPDGDADAMSALARDTDIRFLPGPDGQRVLVGDADVTQSIRTPQVTQLSSPVSAIPGVRRVLVEQQQAMGAGGGVVMEGRDIGTVVFPHAELKVFLTASPEERARRRWLERRSKGDSVSLEEVLEQQAERDARDSSRAESPLRPAEDAVLLDSDGLTAEQVIDRILDMARGRGAA